MFIRHVGVYVLNIDKMIGFYKSVFGLAEIYRSIEEGTITDSMFCENRVKIDVCKLQFEDGSIIELIESLDDRGIRLKNRSNNIDILAR